MAKFAIAKTLLCLLALLVPAADAFSSLQGGFQGGNAALREKLQNDRDLAMAVYLTKLENDKLEALANLELAKEREVLALRSKLQTLLAATSSAAPTLDAALPAPVTTTQDLKVQLAAMKLKLQEKEIDVLTVKLMNLKEQLETQLQVADTKNREIQKLKTSQIKSSMKQLKEALAVKVREQRELEAQARTAAKAAPTSTKVEKSKNSLLKNGGPKANGFNGARKKETKA